MTVAPVGTVITGIPMFVWKSLSQLAVDHYILRYWQVEPRTHQPLTIPIQLPVNGKRSSFALKRPLEPGDYQWQVTAVVNGRDEIANPVSYRAQFSVVPDAYRSSNLLMGIAYFRVGQLSASEERFRLLAKRAETSAPAVSQYARQYLDRIRAIRREATAEPNKRSNHQ
jgi:hypothetical protein